MGCKASTAGLHEVFREFMRNISRMMVDTRDIRSASLVGRNFGAITDEVAEQGSTIVVVKNNRPTVGVVPISVLDEIDSISERRATTPAIFCSLVLIMVTPPLLTVDI